MQTTDLVGLMPRTLGRRAVGAAGLIALDPPMELPPVEISMACTSGTRPTAHTDGCADAYGKRFWI